MRTGTKRWRKAHRPSLLLCLLFVFFTTGAILLYFHGYCLANEIRPPNDATVERWTSSIDSPSGTSGIFDIETVELIKNHRFRDRERDGRIVEDYETEYWLFQVYRAVDGPSWLAGELGWQVIKYQATLDSPTLVAVWVPEGGGVGWNPRHPSRDADDTGGSGLGMPEIKRQIEDSIKKNGLEPGWPVVTIEDRPVPPGPGDDTSDNGGVPGIMVDDDGESQPPEGGSKIPGPGSWWEWLMGTVVAGAIAAGAGLLNAILGGAGLSFPPQGGLPGGTPPPDGYHPAIGLTPGAAPPAVAGSPGFTLTPAPPPLTGFPGQHAPDYGISYGTADPFDIHGVRHPHQPSDGFEDVLDAAFDAATDNVMSQTVRGMFDDIAYNIPVAAFDGLKDAYNWVTVDNLGDLAGDFNDFVRGAENFPKDAAGAAADYTGRALHDPSILMGDLAQGGMAIIKGMDAAFKDPLAIAKTILGTDLWINAMDPNRPPLQRLGYSSLATLRTIFIVKTGMALKGAMAGGGAQAAGAGAVKGGAGAKAGAAKAGTAKLTPQQVAAANKTWSNMSVESSDRISAMKYAVSKGDPKLIEQAALNLKGDPLAVDMLNRSGNTKLINDVNRVLNGTHKQGLGILKGKVANAEGVSPDKVTIVRATNPSPTPKIGMDNDVTVQVLKKGNSVNIPAKDLQPMLDQSYHQAAGSPRHITPQQLGRIYGNEAVDSHSGVAYGYSQKGLGAALKGKSAGSEAGAVAQTMQYKAQGHFAEADRLFSAGDNKAALVQQRLGQRELSKAFNNQVGQRLRAIVEGGDPQKLSLIEKKLPGIRNTHRIVKQMGEMASRNASPLEVADYLRSQGTTMDDLARRVASIYEGLPR